MESAARSILPFQGGRPFGLSLPEDGSPYVVGAVGIGQQRDEGAGVSAVEAAVAAGCDALKLVRRRPEAYYTEAYRKRMSRFSNGGDGRFVRGAGVGVEAFGQMCSDAALDLVVAPWEMVSLEEAERWGPAAYSVEAYVAANARLIDGVAETGRPALVEVNLLSEGELAHVLDVFSLDRVVLMWRQFVPAATGSLFVDHLYRILRLKSWGCRAGYAGEGLDEMGMKVAFGFGAVVLEEPIEDSGSEAGGLSAAAFGRAVKELRDSVRALRGVGTPPLDAELLDRLDRNRLSMVAARDIRRGQVLSEDMIVFRAPYGGLSPRLLPDVLGRRMLYDVPAGAYLTFGLVDL